MKVYSRSSAWKKLNSRRIQSLRPYLSRLGYLPQPKSARPLASKRLPSPRTTRYFKHYSTVSEKTLPFFVRLAFGLNQRQSGQERSASLTFPDEVRFLSRLATMALSQGAGQQPRALPSTCKTSSAVRSYAKLSWLPRDTNSSLAIFPKSSRVSLRGLRITATSLTSSGQDKTPTLRLARRCSAYPALQKSRTPIFAKVQSPLCWAQDMVWAGPHSRRSSWSASSVRRLSATTRPLRRSWVSRLHTSTSS